MSTAQHHDSGTHSSTSHSQSHSHSISHRLFGRQFSSHEQFTITLKLALTVLGVGTLSFYTIVFGVLRNYRGDDVITPEDLHSEVSPNLFHAQAAAFGSILVLNILNLFNQQTATQRNCHVLLVFVHLVAFSTDMLLANDLVPIVRSPNGRILVPLRYIQWCHSTPSMLLVLSTLAELSVLELGSVIFFDIVMMLTGLFACWTTGAWAAANTITSFVTFVPVLYYMRQMTQAAIREANNADAVRILRLLEALMIGVWNAFPVVWILAYTGLISSQTEQLLWGICDYMGKVAFSSHLWHNNFMTTAQRREAALMAWEESNRTMTIDKLRQLVTSKERMVRTMSHELKTPITGIIALANEMITNGRLQAAEECMASVVRSSGHCLLNIIESNVGDGPGVPLSRKCLSVHTVVSDVEAIVRPLVREGVKLVNCITKSFPPVVGDETKLTQVLFNLLGYATRHTEKGHINISATTSQKQARINVSDTGVGLHADKVVVLNKRLQKNEDLLAVLGSNGLSLFLVKQHLEAIGSSLEVASELGRGTTFSFTLPLLDDSLVHEDLLIKGRATTDDDLNVWDGATLVPMVRGSFSRGNSSNLVTDLPLDLAPIHRDSTFPSKACHRAKNGGTLQVMCVVDDMINQMVAEAILRSQGWKVLRALDGNKAFEVVREAEFLPDVVLLDVTVPGMTGYEIITKFREIYSSAVLPIIMISARATEGSIVAALKNGADDYIVKPFKRAELIARIRAQVRARDSLQQTRARESEWFLRHNLLPDSIRQRLQDGDKVVAEQHARATVMWLSILDFGQLAATLTPMDLVVMINHFHATVERLCEEEQVQGIDFTGSTFVAVSGHDSHPQHAAKMLSVARKILATASGIKCPNGTPLKVSVGLHTGPVTSGLVGVRAVKYTLMGDAVEATRCLAGNGWPYCIHLSSAMYNAMPVADQSNCVPWASDADPAVRGVTEPALGTLHGEVGTTYVLNTIGDPMAPVLERAAQMSAQGGGLSEPAAQQLLLQTPARQRGGASVTSSMGRFTGDDVIEASLGGSAGAVLVSQQLRSIMDQTASLQQELRALAAQHAGSQSQLAEWRQVAAELRAALPAAGAAAAASDSVAAAVVQQQIDALVDSAEQLPSKASSP